MLTEIVRRADQACEQLLLKQLSARADAAKKAAEEAKRETEQNPEKKVRIRIGSGRDENENFELLTALRRVQKKPDPLTIEVSFPWLYKSNTRELPAFQVSLKNVHEEKAPVWIKHGGDYRSGREAPWRFEVRDANGKLLPQRQWHAMMGGGMFSQGPLAPGKSWKTTLPMDSYVKITEPGEYTVRVLYHNEQTIADLDDVSGLILCSSKPFKLKVTKAPPKVITLEAESHQRAKALIAGLREDGPIRVVMGEYDASFHDFIDPKSPEGQLHTMGWQAVPELLDALRDPKLSFRKRGWILAMLYVIACERDLNPFESREMAGVLPAYEYRSIGCTGSGSGRGDEKKQKELADAWLRLAAEYLEFRPSP